MIPIQAARLNSRLKDPDGIEILSPSQRDLLALVRKHPEAGWHVAIGKEFSKAWKEAEAIQGKLRN